MKLSTSENRLTRDKMWENLFQGGKGIIGQSRLMSINVRNADKWAMKHFLKKSSSHFLIDSSSHEPFTNHMSTKLRFEDERRIFYNKIRTRKRRRRETNGNSNENANNASFTERLKAAVSQSQVPSKVLVTLHRWVSWSEVLDITTGIITWWIESFCLLRRF